jgi:hypothetical protein
MKSIKIKDLTWDSSIYPRTAKSQQTINTWITDIRARQKINRNNTIIRLSRLGWTQEKQDKAITIFDYHSLLSKTGWKTIFRIECPLSTERLTGNQVQKMQDKRILGTIGRTLLIAKKTSKSIRASLGPIKESGS